MYSWIQKRQRNQRLNQIEDPLDHRKSKGIPEKHLFLLYQVSSVQLFDRVLLFATHGLQHSRLPVHHNSQSLLIFMSFGQLMPSNHLILSCPLLLSPSIFPSIRVFSNESVLHIRWPKYWSFSFSISPSNEYSGLISFIRCKI